MEFKVTTFFEKYKIEPNVEKEKIKLMFQTDPNKRKDLPVVLKIISSDEKLFEEELFTKHSNNELLEKHTKLEELIEVVKNQSIASNSKDISKLIIELANEEEYYKHFFFGNKLPNDKAKKLFDDYILCIIDKLKHEFYGSIGEVSNDLLKNMYNSISEIFNKVERFKNKKDDFDEDLCDYLNNVLTLDEKGKELTNRFCSLVFLEKLVKKDYYTNSIKYTIEKMNKNVEKFDNVLVGSYEYICKVFKGKSLKEVSSFISNLIFRNLYLRGEKTLNENKKSLKKLTELQKCCLLYEKYKSIEDKDFDIAEELCDFVVFAGQEWQNDYNIAVKEMIENSTEDTIYNVVELIVDQNPSEEVLRVFANIITDLTGFNSMLEYIITTHEASMKHTSDKYINPTDVDVFIAKYYWLAFTNFDENITKEFFNNIRNIGFDILAINESSLELINNSNVDYWTRELIRSRILETYEILPGDWIMSDGTTIRQMFRKLGKEFNGKDGVSASMIREYNRLFRNMKKRISKLYYCPDCDYRTVYGEEKCGKCGIALDWDEVEPEPLSFEEAFESNDVDDTDDEENYMENNYTQTNSSSATEVGCIIWFIIGFIIFCIIMANS